MKNSLTDRQKELLSIIYQYIKSTGYPPTFEEMREKLGVSSNQSILDLLAKLEQKEVIKRNESAARGLAILPAGYALLGQPPLVAFLGVTSAGAPIEAITIPGEWQELIGGISQLKGEVCLLKISGDSMVNAGIDDGDVVLVKQDQEFVSGEVVLAQVGTEMTIKRFMTSDEPPYLYLKPENPKYGIILFEDNVELKGKVLSILKQGYWKPLP